MLGNTSMSMANISHNAERITALGDKLSQIQLGIQNDKYSKLFFPINFIVLISSII